MSANHQGYDFIGDVHGQRARLERLLAGLGYVRHRFGWRHSEGRVAVFVGDLIDRGAEQVATLAIVRSMIDSGCARAVMGNHELNAIGWYTPDPDRKGQYLRIHGSRNEFQHAAFLRDVARHPSGLHAELVRWFQTLPLWLDLPGARVVHACWHPSSIARLSQLLGKSATLSDPQHLIDAFTRGRELHRLVEITTKGPEIALPEGTAFNDGYGVTRRTARVRWWLQESDTYRDLCILPEADAHQLPSTPISTDVREHDPDGRPVFFGHYWLTGTPEALSAGHACVDHSAGAGGPLVCYRFNGEAQLSNDAFCDDATIHDGAQDAPRRDLYASMP